MSSNNIVKMYRTLDEEKCSWLNISFGECTASYKTIDNEQVRNLPLSQTGTTTENAYVIEGDDYWNGEPRMCKFYKEAYDIRRKRDDEDAWWQGLYIYDAFCRVSPVLNAFAKNGTKPLPYVDKPYTQSDKYKQINEKLSDEEEQKLIENERLKARVTFDAWARAVNRQMKTKEKIEEGGI